MAASCLLLLALATTPVQALGQAPVVAGNRAAARDRALEEALKQAVDQALAYVLEPDARLRAQAQLRREVVARARTYVPTYRVLDEHEIEGGLFQVQIEAQVDTILLRRDATAVAGGGGGGGGGGGSRPGGGGPAPPAPGAAGRPRVLIAAGGPVALAVRKAVETAGFLEAPLPMGEPPRGDSEAAALLRGAGAGIVIVAAAEVHPEGRLRGLAVESTFARVELRALDAEAHALARGAAEGRGFAEKPERAADEALESATGRAGQRCLGELAARFSAGAGGGSGPEGGVLIRAAGLQSLRDLEALQQQIGQLPGVIGVSPRRLGGGEAWLGVRTTRTGGTLAAAMRAQGLEVDAASDREVRVRVQRTAP